VRKVLIAPTLAMMLIVSWNSAHQAQASTTTIRGTVLRNGKTDPIPEVNVSLQPAMTSEALDALITANSVLVGPEQTGMSQAPQFLNMPLADLEARIGRIKTQSLPPAVMDAVDKLYAARKASEGFPKAIVSDSSGRFSFDGVPVGRYTLIAEREGFYGVPTTGSSALVSTASVTVDASNPNRVPEVAINMIPGGLISGQVRNANGQPQTDIPVQAFSITYNAGLPVLQTAAANATNDRGEFRLFWLPPGEYLVGATPRPSGGGQRGAPPPVPAAGGDATVKTFYPNAPQPAQATFINVKIGEEISGINIDLRTVRAVKLSGQVINGLGPLPVDPNAQANSNPLPPPSPTAGLMLLPRDMAAPEDTGARNLAALDVSAGFGKFEVSGIMPGLYDLYGRIQDPRGSGGQGGQTAAWGRIPIEVLDRDLVDLTIVVHASVEMSGTVLLNGSAPGATASAMRLALQPDGSSSKLPNYNGILGRPATPTPEGAFKIPGIGEGAYRFVVNGLPQNGYVEDIRAGGRPVYDTGIYVADKPVDSVQVLVKTDGGIVQGKVSTADRKPAGRVTVVLVPESLHRPNASLYKTTMSDAEGAFTLRGVRPGIYKIFAWESVANGAWLNTVFLSKVESRGVVVNVAPSTTANSEVPLIPRS
jgi:hypothetical protein